jgi:hypothetical protein
MNRTILAAVLLAGTALAALPAKADTILGFTTLDAAAVVPQSASAPCIICATMQAHNPADFGFNNYVNTGNLDTGVFWSTAQVGGSLANGVETGAIPYTVGQIGQALLNNFSFSVVIDVNSAEGGNPPTIMQLISFQLFRVNADLTEIDRLAHTNQTYALPDIRPGEGHGDYLLTGFDLSGLQLGDRLIFRAEFTGATDGPDSFYITASPAVAVPGPIAGAGIPGLIAAAFGMVGFNRFRRRRTAVG